jgi:hypothetical protein
VVTTPDKLTADYIATRWPRLYHMAEAGSWSSIQQFGLRSTTALLDLFEIHGAERESIEAARRPESVQIHHAVHGTAWIRDNKPINETVLRRTLVGVSEPEWYRSLNGRVFFWLNEDRLTRLRNAPPYRTRPHDVLILSTEKLLEAHANDVELSPLNSGAVHPAANYSRGAETFRSIDDYPWSKRLALSPVEPIVELTVRYSVPDPASLVVDVQTI